MDAPPPEQRHALQVAARSLQACGLEARSETKPGSIAVHWRGLSAHEKTVIENRLRGLFASLVEHHGLQLLPFDGGLELRAPGKNKGDAVNTILTEAGPHVAAAYLGDDQTDENAFRAIKGRGISILVRNEPRPTMADLWLRPPDELGQFLRDWLVACGAEI